MFCLVCSGHPIIFIMPCVWFGLFRLCALHSCGLLFGLVCSGRLFDGHVLDMVEFGIDKFVSMMEIKVSLTLSFFLRSI